MYSPGVASKWGRERWQWVQILLTVEEHGLCWAWQNEDRWRTDPREGEELLKWEDSTGTRRSGDEAATEQFRLESKEALKAMSSFPAAEGMRQFDSRPS